jgi:hypothetical protein
VYAIYVYIASLPLHCKTKHVQSYAFAIYVYIASLPLHWKTKHVQSYCKKMVKDETNKMNFTIKSSLIYTKPNRRNKSKSTCYVIKKKSNGKVVAHKVGKKE